MDLGISERVKPILADVTQFITEEVRPLDKEYAEQVATGDRWQFTERQTEIIETLKAKAREKGLSFMSVDDRPAGSAMQLEPVKIGLWDRYGGSMPSGWTRMILEDFEFDFDVLYPPDFDDLDPLGAEPGVDEVRPVGPRRPRWASP